MSRFIRVAAPAAAAIIAGACASACATTAANAAEDIAGCYYFERNAAASELALPWGIRLLDRPLEGWPAFAQLEDVHVAATLTPDGDLDHPFGYWRPLDQDSILVGYPAGGGLSLRLAASDMALTGTAVPVGDALPLGGEADRSAHAVRLTHARCPQQ